MVWSSRSYQRISSSSFLTKEKKLAPVWVVNCCRFCICANSHDREITAWALSNSMFEVALISLEMTLSK